MKLQFKEQQFQLDAVSAIADIFQRAKPNKLELGIWLIQAVKSQMKWT